MVYYKGILSIRWTTLGGSKTLFFLSFPLRVYGKCKNKCNINKKVRSNRYFFLLYLGECIFRGSSIKMTGDLTCFLLQRGKRRQQYRFLIHLLQKSLSTNNKIFPHVLAQGSVTETQHSLLGAISAGHSLSTHLWAIYKPQRINGFVQNWPE